MMVAARKIIKNLWMKYMNLLRINWMKKIESFKIEKKKREIILLKQYLNCQTEKIFVNFRIYLSLFQWSFYTIDLSPTMEYCRNSSIHKEIITVKTSFKFVIQIRLESFGVQKLSFLRRKSINAVYGTQNQMYIKEVSHLRVMISIQTIVIDFPILIF